MHREGLVIRPAQRCDLSAIERICQKTFAWGDYLPRAFLDLLEDDTGQMLVGQVKDEIVGLVRLSRLSSDEGWLEAMRIHPKWRRCGLAHQLTCQARDALLSQGVSVVRLAIGRENRPSQQLAAKNGFCPAFSLVEYTSRGGQGRVWPATCEDIPSLLSLVEQGSAWGEPVDRHRDILGYEWRWSQVRQDTLTGLVKREKIWTNGCSWAVIDCWPDHEELTVHTPYGSSSGIAHLVNGLYERYQQPIRITLVRYLDREQQDPKLCWSDPEQGDIIYEYWRED